MNTTVNTQLEDYHFKNGKFKTAYENLMCDFNTEKVQHDAYIENAVPVLPKLKKFYDEVKHKYPSITFVLSKYPSIMTFNSKDPDVEYPVYGSIDIAFSDATDIIVGALYYETDKNGNDRYGVISDRISNEKYSQWHKSYHSKCTKNFKSAVKNALQYIKPTQITDLNNPSSVRNFINESINEVARDKLNEAMRIPIADLKTEIQMMIASGYVPKTPKFVNAFNMVRDEGEELARIENYKPDMVFVWLKPDRAEYIGKDGSPMVAHTVEELPEELRNKIAVLQISEINHPIMDVGMKVGDTKYWVFLSK